MQDPRLGSLLRNVRLRRGLRQEDLAAAAGLSRSTISLIERGHCETLSLAAIRRAAGALDIRVDVLGRWRGGDSDRLLSRRHSHLAERFATFLASNPGWVIEPEVSFSIYGERGVVDQLAWHVASGHLLLIELKTEFVDVNEMLGTFDRKRRLATAIAATRGWCPTAVSAWLIVTDTKTNRRHAAQHSTLLRSRFQLDGRQLRPLLKRPSGPTTGLAFWTDSNPGSARPDRGPVRRPRAASPRSSAGKVTLRAVPEDSNRRFGGV
jgi:transcriptional regulator with XRE-family HTH domain